MNPIKDNACMIDMIAKEAIIRNVAKLKKAKVKTMPYASTVTNTLTGNHSGHCGMIFHYKNDTWHYDNMLGSVRVFRNKHSKDYVDVVKKAYTFHPHLVVDRVFPLSMCEFSSDIKVPLPNKFINKS